MSASYAHILLSRELVNSEQISGFHSVIQDALMLHSPYIELGALSPDLPALHIENKNQEQWTNLMHAPFTKIVIESGIKYIINLLENNADMTKIQKLIAWLFGYISHVVVDTTIHPIVNCINNASYLEDALKHVVCEMHQDSYIYYVLMGLPSSERIAFLSGASKCCDKKSSIISTKIDNDITEIWDSMLNSAFKDYYEKCPPEFNNWFKRFIIALKKGAEFASYFAYFRNKCNFTKGKTFPEPHEIDDLYISDIKTPNNRILNYKEIFCEAQKNTFIVWEKISNVLFSDRSKIGDILGNWDLMTGKAQDGIFVFWEETK